MSVVIDTNVLSVSDGHADQAGPGCVVRRVRALEQAMAGVVSLDSGFEIIREYLRNVSHRPPSGLGAAFVLHLQRNLFNPKRCEQVRINRDPSRGYAEFPDDPQLERFDRSDRKFVAVALASAYSPPILNAAGHRLVAGPRLPRPPRRHSRVPLPGPHTAQRVSRRAGSAVLALIRDTALLR